MFYFTQVSTAKPSILGLFTDDKGLEGTISPLIGCPPLVTSLTYLDFGK